MIQQRIFSLRKVLLLLVFLFTLSTASEGYFRKAKESSRGSTRQVQKERSTQNVQLRSLYQTQTPEAPTTPEVEAPTFQAATYSPLYTANVQGVVSQYGQPINIPPGVRPSVNPVLGRPEPIISLPRYTVTDTNTGTDTETNTSPNVDTNTGTGIDTSTSPGTDNDANTDTDTDNQQEPAQDVDTSLGSQQEAPQESQQDIVQVPEQLPAFYALPSLAIQPSYFNAPPETPVPLPFITQNAPQVLPLTTTTASSPVEAQPQVPSYTTRTPQIGPAVYTYGTTEEGTTLEVSQSQATDIPTAPPTYDNPTVTQPPTSGGEEASQLPLLPISFNINGSSSPFSYSVQAQDEASSQLYYDGPVVNTSSTENNTPQDPRDYSYQFCALNTQNSKNRAYTNSSQVYFSLSLPQTLASQTLSSQSFNVTPAGSNITIAQISQEAGQYLLLVDFGSSLGNANDVEDKIDPKEVFPNDSRDIYTDIQGHEVIQHKRNERDSSLRHIYYNLPNVNINQSQTNVLQFTTPREIKQHQDYLKYNCKNIKSEKTLYDFYMSSYYAVSQFQHFQLRNIVYATSKHDIYMGFRDKILHWNPYNINKQPQEVLDLSGRSIAQNRTQSLHQHQFQMSTMCVKDDILAVGGFVGELLVKNLKSEGALFKNWVSTSSNPITNALEIYKTRQGQQQLVASNNDAKVRILDLQSAQIIREISLNWAVNYSTVNPVNPDIVACVGDGLQTHLVDTRSGRIAQTINGHLDYSFAAAWSPDGSLLATGNQDCTTRVYDTRSAYSSKALLKAQVGPIRSLRFSPDGKTLATLENWDYVVLFNVTDNFSSKQNISFLGQPNGMAFSPDDGGQFFFVSIFNLMSHTQYNNSNLAVFKQAKDFQDQGYESCNL